MGVRWVMSPREVAAACRAAGGSAAVFEESQDAMAIARQLAGQEDVPADAPSVLCNRPPVDVGVSGLVHTFFCEGIACEVSIIVDPPTLESFLKLQGRLYEKYGPPAFSENTRQTADGPVKIDEDSLADAVLCKHAERLRRNWYWNGRPEEVGNILLSAGCQQGTLIVAMFYRNVFGVARRLIESKQRRQNF
jgi:hypothetical protein